jgi:PhzF family phenazine biosynthesis protein
MKSYSFKKIDAFATSESGGNPAAIVTISDFDEISSLEMQRIARELKGFVCETCFLARIASDAFKVCYFSSEKEVQFCGHATIAAAYDCVRNNPAIAELPHFFFHTNKGILLVENRVLDQDAVYIHAPIPIHAQCTIPLPEVCKALNLSENSVDPSIEVGIVDAGNQTLCVPLRSLNDIVGAHPDYNLLLAFCQLHQLDVVAVFSREVADSSNHLRTRVFAPPFGYLEDPATGSGNAAIGYHLLRTGDWAGEPIRIEQNANIQNPNIVRLATVLNTECGGLRVIFGGSAILRIDGRYRIG